MAYPFRPLPSLPPPAALHVLRFAASFVWADLDVGAREHAFLRALATEVGLGDECADALLRRPPSAESVDPLTVPAHLASIIREVALRAIAADGLVRPHEMELWDLLDELLPDERARSGHQMTSP